MITLGRAAETFQNWAVYGPHPECLLSEKKTKKTRWSLTLLIGWGSNFVVIFVEKNTS